MNKYFTKNEVELLINLLKSWDYNNVLLAFTFIQSLPSYKNFKKLYSTREKYKYKYTLEEDIRFIINDVNNYSKHRIPQETYSMFFDYYHHNCINNIIKFIRKRIKK